MGREVSGLLWWMLSVCCGFPQDTQGTWKQVLAEGGCCLCRCQRACCAVRVSPPQQVTHTCMCGSQTPHTHTHLIFVVSLASSPLMPGADLTHAHAHCTTPCLRIRASRKLSACRWGREDEWQGRLKLWIVAGVQLGWLFGAEVACMEVSSSPCCCCGPTALAGLLHCTQCAVSCS